jgi:indole-3-glycerol phosphate synthase
VLGQIIAARREAINRQRDLIREKFLAADSLPRVRDFLELFNTDGRVGLLAEVKKASPVKGTFLPDLNPAELALIYQRNGAKGISVITEEKFFRGDPTFIEKIKDITILPVMRKDFVVDEVQLYESRLLGADAVLLITFLLRESLPKFVELAHKLGLETVVEVHDREELRMALDAPTQIIGINNRNLKDFKVDTRVSLELIEQVPAGIYCIAESGIGSQNDMYALEKYGFDAALVGEALVTANDIGAQVRELAEYREVSRR